MVIHNEHMHICLIILKFRQSTCMKFYQCFVNIHRFCLQRSHKGRWSAKKQGESMMNMKQSFIPSSTRSVQTETKLFKVTYCFIYKLIRLVFFKILLSTVDTPFPMFFHFWNASWNAFIYIFVIIIITFFTCNWQGQQIFSKNIPLMCHSPNNRWEK